jgi:hypothetical protein
VDYDWEEAGRTHAGEMIGHTTSAMPQWVGRMQLAALNRAGDAYRRATVAPPAVGFPHVAGGVR